jgi:hypothetical protein
MTDLRRHDGEAPGTSEQPGTATQAKQEAAQVASTAAEQGKETASAAAEAAAQTAGTAAEGAKQVASEAAQQVTEVTRQAADQARELVGQAQAQLREQAVSQTERAAGGLSDVGRQIRALAEGRTDEAGFAADGARQIAETIDGLAGRIQQRGFDGTVQDLTNFARRRPGTFLLSAAAAGFVVGRLGRGMQAAQEQSGTGGAPGAMAAQPAPLVPPPTPLGASDPYLPDTGVPGMDGGV